MIKPFFLFVVGVMLTSAALASPASAQNQASRVSKPGFHYEAGVGVSYSGFGNYVDLSPEAGVLYRIGAKDAFGLTVQGRLPMYKGESHLSRDSYQMVNLFLSHTHDFADASRSFFLEYEIGLADLFNHRGPHLGVEAGYRIPLAGWGALRMAAVMDWERLMMKFNPEWRTAAIVGVTVRLEI